MTTFILHGRWIMTFILFMTCLFYSLGLLNGIVDCLVLDSRLLCLVDINWIDKLGSIDQRVSWFELPVLIDFRSWFPLWQCTETVLNGDRLLSYLCVNNKRCHETPHRPHRRQIQILGIGNMCLLRYILLISIKKRNRLQFSCISDLHFLLLLLIQCKISLYLGASAADAVFRDTQ